MANIHSELIPVEHEISKETENLFHRIRTTLTNYPPRKQLYGVEFEQQFAQMCGSVYAISTFASSVLRHVIQSMTVSEGDEIICSGWIRPEYVRSILATKLVPIFCEINPYTLGLDYLDVSLKLSPRTKAIVVVHTCGIPADLESFVALCKEKNLQLIEVVPCEMGSTYKQKTLGTFGMAGIIEYHPQHIYSNQDACILITDTESIARRVRSMSFYEHRLGTFSELQGALGLWDISSRDATSKIRREVAYRFNRSFEKMHGVSIFHEHTISHWGHQTYPIRVSAKFRDDLVEHITSHGLSAKKPEKLAHVHSYIQNRLRPPQLLQTEKIIREIIKLPTVITKPNQDRLVQLIQDFIHTYTN